MPNPYKQTAQLQKAWALEHAIVAAWDGLTDEDRRGRSLADAVETWSDEEWTVASIKAGVHEPSAETRALVVKGLRIRAESEGKDPFAGLAA